MQGGIIVYQFNSYLESILENLNINKRQRLELKDEFRDHLENLKQEYMNQGFNEDAAVQKAIMDFGNDRELSIKLNEAMFHYRTKPNIIFGFGYIAFSIAFYVTGIYLIGAVQSPQSSIEYAQISSICIILDILGTSVIAYFIPIVNKKAITLKQVFWNDIIIIASLFSVTIVFMLISSSDGLNPVTIPPAGIVKILISIITVPIFSSVLGFKILNLVNEKTSKAKELAR
jgi:hypothetical protein